MKNKKIQFIVFFLGLIGFLVYPIILKEFSLMNYLIGMVMGLFFPVLFICIYSLRKTLEEDTNEKEKEVTLEYFFQKDKFEEFKIKILTLNCVKNDFTWTGKKQDISVLYHKINNNNYLISEGQYNKKDFERALKNFLKHKASEGLLSKHKIENPLSISNKDSERSEIEKFYMDDLSVFGNN